MIKNVLGDRTVIIHDHYDEDWSGRISIEGRKWGENAIINKLSVVPSQNGETYLVRSRNIQRPIHNPSDTFSHAKLYSPTKATSESIAAVTMVVQEKKVADTVLPYERNVKEYNPESDVVSDNNVLIVDRNAADMIENIGLNMEGISNEYEGIESIAPNVYQSNLVDDIVVIKRDIRDVMSRISMLMQYYRSRGELSGEVYSIRQLYSIENESLPVDLARELADFSGLYGKYMELQRVIINETAERIKIPDMFMEPFKQNRNEFIDEIISMGDNVLKI